MRKIDLKLLIFIVAPIFVTGPATVPSAAAETHPYLYGPSLKGQSSQQQASIPQVDNITTGAIAAKPKTKNKTERLNDLFSELKREPNERKAKQLASRIAINWSTSGSATTDALMAWAQQAMRDGRHSTALELLDQVIVLRPDFAEGWNRRATLHFAMRNHVKSMADIERTLALEPRHFGALSGMASILAARGKDEDALKIYEYVLTIYPAHQTAQKSVLKLLEKLEKSEI